MITHSELLTAVWQLATNALEVPDEHRALCIHWTAFHAGYDSPAGFIVTLEGAPPPAWLIAHLGPGGNLHLVHAAAADDATAIADTKAIHTRFEHAQPGFGVLQDAVRAWLKSDEPHGHIEPE